MERALGKKESPGFVVGTTEYAPCSLESGSPAALWWHLKQALQVTVLGQWCPELHLHNNEGFSTLPTCLFSQQSRAGLRLAW